MVVVERVVVVVERVVVVVDKVVVVVYRSGFSRKSGGCST